MFKNKKTLRTGVLSLAAVVLLTTGGYAAGKVYRRKVTATFGTINFEYEGKDVTKEIENKYSTPGFVMESRSYVPVRAIGDVLGVDVDYDVVTKTAKISDPKKAEMEKKDGKIKELESENDKLKKEIESLKNSGSSNTDRPSRGDVKALESALNKDYGKYRDIPFSFSLKERNNSTIDVLITADFVYAKHEYDWGKMSTSDKKYFVENITDDIQRDFPDYDIKGVITDNVNLKDLMSFTKRPRGVVSISYYGGSVDSSYVEKKVEDEFYDLGIKDARLDKIYEDRGIIYFDISFSDYYRSEWNDLSKAEVRRALNRVASVIDLDYTSGKYRLSGLIRCGSDRAGYYDRDYNGDVELTINSIR